MRHRLNRTQRVVIVVGLGFVLYVLGLWVGDLGLHPFTGWTGYAPLQNNAFSLVNGGLHPWVRVVLWMMLIMFWTLTSLWLLRTPSTLGAAEESGKNPRE